MSRASVIIGAYLGLLVLICAGLSCFADYTPCQLGNYSEQLLQEIDDLYNAEEDYEEDDMCCHPSSWVIDEKSGALGLGFQLPRPGKVKTLTLEKYMSNEWVFYTQLKLFREDYLMSGDEDPISTGLCKGYKPDEIGYHTFEYISSGRYRLSSCINFKDMEHNITTQFDESRLTCNCSESHYFGPWTEDGTFSVTITFYQPLTYKMDKIYTLVDANGTVVTKWSIRARKVDNQTLVCETNGQTPVSYNPTPDLEENGQSFVIENLSPGSYKLEVVSYGQLAIRGTELDICQKTSTVPFKHFRPTTEESKSGATVRLPTNEGEGNILAPSMIGMVSVVALCSCYYIVHIIRKKKNLDPLKKPGRNDKDTGRKKVLLLYARDCPQFNDLMVTFRDLLKHSNFQVFDCYDPERSREVDKNPTLWIRSLVGDRQVQVVVVASRCAQLQHSAVTGGRTVLYQLPHHLDRLFLYGLTDVLNMNKDVYIRIFRVALQEFTEKDDMLSLLGESRIYTLPVLVLELIRDLRCSSKTPEETEDFKKRVTVLKEKHNILVSHKNANTDYLHNIVVQY